MALCATKKITLAEDTEDAGESDVDGASLKECIGDKSMEQETVSFRFIYLKRAMDRWGARTNISWEQKIRNIWWIKYFDRR